MRKTNVKKCSLYKLILRNIDMSRGRVNLEFNHVYLKKCIAQQS